MKQLHADDDVQAAERSAGASSACTRGADRVPPELLFEWRALLARWHENHGKSLLITQFVDAKMDAWLAGAGERPDAAELLKAEQARRLEAEAREEVAVFVARLGVADVPRGGASGRS